MTHDHEETQEAMDPVAHPHYPMRPTRSARPIYTIVEEEVEEAGNLTDSLKVAPR